MTQTSRKELPTRSRARILYHYSSQQFDTGSPKALVAMIGLLDRARFEPVYLATGDGPLIDALAAQNVRIVRGEVTSVSYRHPLAALGKALRQARLLRRLEINLLHMNEFGWNQDLVLGAWLRGIPVVLHLHNPASIAFQNLHRFAASKVLTVSEAAKGTVTNLHRIRHKCEVLYNSVDLGHMGCGRPIRESLGLSSQDIVIGTIGQISYRKGIDVVLETARILLPRWQRLRFLVVGPKGIGEESFADEMMQRAKEPGFAGRVHFLGSRSDIPDLLASMDIFFLPTRAEPFGIVIIEAMAAGVPVVASRVGGIPEIIKSDDNGRIVDPILPEAFAAAISEILQMPDGGRGLGERGRRSLSGRFDRPTTCARLEAIYDGLLARADVPDRQSPASRA